MDKGFDANVYAAKAEKIIQGTKSQKDLNYYKEKNIESTSKTFKTNLEQACETKLKEKYPKGFYKVDVAIRYDEKTENFTVDHVKIAIKDSSIDRIQKVEINTSSSTSNLNTKVENEEQMKIKEYLSEELRIAKERIYFSKL